VTKISKRYSIRLKSIQNARTLPPYNTTQQQKVNEMRLGVSETTFHAENDVAGRFSLASHTFEH